jgi:hypothetical protein
VSDYVKQSLLKVAEGWPKSHLDDYIKNLESQVEDIRKLLHELKTIQSRKQREINRKLRNPESGTRGGT